MRPDLRHGSRWLVLGWLLIGVVVTLCLLPGPTVEPVAKLLSDKAEHALAFLALTAWFCGLYPARRWVWVAIAFVLLGILIEVAQGAFTTTRQMDPKDALADSIGVAAALLLARWGLGEWSVHAERLLGAKRSP